MTVYNVAPAALSAPVSEVDTTSPNNTRTFNGFDVTLNARFPNGAFLTAGTSTGRDVSKTCDVTDPNATRNCDQSAFDIPFLTTFKGTASYPLWRGARIGAVFQSTPGDALSYTYLVTAANFRTLTGVTMGQSSVTLRLSEPGSQYLKRVNQLDLTLAKPFKTPHGITFSPEISLFNVLNANPVLSATTAYPAVGTPLAILDGRLLRFNLQMRF